MDKSKTCAKSDLEHANEVFFQVANVSFITVETCDSVHDFCATVRTEPFH